MSGQQIALEIMAAIIEAGEAVGDGPLEALILRKGEKSGPDYAPVYGPNQEHRFYALLGTFTSKERENTSIRSTDTKITLTVGDVEPVTSDEIKIKGVTYEVHGVEPVNPGGVDLMYEIWARN